MKLTESALRNIIREELKKEMNFIDKEDIEAMKPKSAKDFGIMGLISLIISSPMLLRQFLQAHPDMMQQLQDFVNTHLMKEGISDIGIGSALGTNPSDPMMQELTTLTNELHKAKPEEVDKILSNIQQVVAKIRQARMQK